MSVDTLPSLVVDNGSGWIKGGLAQYGSPSLVFPSVAGRHKVPAMSMYFDKDVFCGEEAMKKRPILSLRYPVEHGIITNWDYMERLWEYLFEDLLSVRTEEHSLLLTEPALNPRANREKMTQIMFETFNFPFLYLSVTSVLSLLASGRDTGVVIDSGEDVTHTVPVFRGHTRDDSIFRLDIAGRDLTAHLTRIFCERGYAFVTSCERELVRSIKESLAFVSTDYEGDLQRSQESDELERSYRLPDGTLIATLGSERFRCVEPLFSPCLMGSTWSGVHELAHRSILKCNKHLHQCLYANIVLSGGNTMFSGMRERVDKEMSKLAPVSSKVNVISPPDRQYSSWIGGSVLATSDGFENMCIRRLEDYEEFGPNIVYRKCL